VLISRLRGADSSRVQLRAAFRDSTGRPRDDITLTEDDEIRVFAVTEFRTPEYVVITGAVRQPGRFPYREGITLRDLVMLAGGLDSRASLRDAEIARLPRSRESGQLATSERVSLDSSYLLVGRNRESGSVAQAGASRDIALRPYDNVLIPTDLDLTQTRQVVITGEVKAPGTYTLLTKNDRLGDLLARAGGLTNAAYIDGIVFTRASGKLGRVGLDLRSVLRDSMSRDNIILADGDSIYLPQFSGIVEVKGAVHAPRGVAWIPGKDLDYYVRAAGGPTSTGDFGRSYVMQPDGSVETVRARRLLPDDIPVPRPGSVVTVTERDQKQGSDSVARLSIVAQIVASMVALAAVIGRK
ncbi:MAG TPA: SLBB domain-containing protein, partial [Gemmatimonadaceae bacterium]